MNLLKLIMSQAFAGGSLMPPQGTAISGQVDKLYEFLLIASLISSIILIGGMIYFALKYKRKTDNDKTAYITHNTFLEFLWSFIPLVIFMISFVWGWIVFHRIRNIPENALEVNVRAKQWSWDFLYKSGKKVGGEFYVPVNTPVKLIMTSEDVLHSFYIPSMRIKQDVIPGRYTSLWFNADKLGDYHIFCTEYCGAAHSAMLAKMKVVSQAEYEKWLQENDDALSPLQRGQKNYMSLGCVACHSVDGKPATGPTWKGIFGTQRALADGSSVLADENYLRESILNAQAKIVKGFGGNGMPSVMPPYQGQLSEDQVLGLIEYIKSLK
jgi:cytochrome c oxidase subunit II